MVAQFAPAGGRTFEAEKDVTVRLVPAAHRPPPLPDVPDGPTLPPPRKVDGADGVGWRSTPKATTAEPAPLIDAVEFRAPVPMPSR